MTDIDQLIDDLSLQAAPVHPRQNGFGRAVLVLLAAISIAALALIFGLRRDILLLQAPIQLFLALGLFALLASATGLHAIRLARPEVGAPSSSAGWLVAALALFPLIASAALFSDPVSAVPALHPADGLRCLGVGLLAGSASLVFLTLWLRSGAVVAPVRAGWIAGLASGAIGAFAVSLECGNDEFVHLGIWHVAVVAGLAIIGRLAIPPLVRW
jgi:hypothetical protein